ncbi:hypothetical protein HYH03_017046 [Edaphochlamys debaryana]|uniref:Peptidase M11 gametolysin domain-containing protein n=1 Tax=Edaphochlamys debaryana TaxID=47281 RepID=A0A835XIK4_9CHLO|nr:hypothetical protein HYH03_017046 [Edaphochlamys debaryana]|eukprot:KAG2484094.1 hypothetical protein HYH03_017046 [Edaphochlamys debaryana]
MRERRRAVAWRLAAACAIVVYLAPAQIVTAAATIPSPRSAQAALARTVATKAPAAAPSSTLAQASPATIPAASARLRGLLTLLGVHTANYSRWALSRSNDSVLVLLPRQPADSYGNPIPPGNIIQLVCTPDSAIPTLCLAADIAQIFQSAAGLAPARGRASLLVISVSLAGACAAASTPPADVTAAFWGPRGPAATPPGGYAGVLADCSYGALQLNNTGFRAVAVAIPCSGEALSCMVDVIAAAASSAAAAQLKTSLGAWTHRMYVLPAGVDCGWAGLSTLGGRETWVLPTVWGIFRQGTVLQEFMRNFGLRHAWANGYEYADSSTFMGFGSSCPSAPELLRVGWATPLATLNASNLPIGIAMTYILPATCLGPANVTVRIVPTWMGAAQTINLYLSYRVARAPDASLPPESDGQLHLHTTQAAADSSPAAGEDPRFNLVRLLGPGRGPLDLAAMPEVPELAGLKLVLQTRDLLDGGSRMRVDLCLYTTTAAAQCLPKLPPVPTYCPPLPGYVSTSDADTDAAFNGETVQLDLSAMQVACGLDPSCRGFSWLPNALPPYGFTKTSAVPRAQQAKGVCLYARLFPPPPPSPKPPSPRPPSPLPSYVYGRNYALRRPAFASSVFDGAPCAYLNASGSRFCGPEYAVDGNRVDPSRFFYSGSKDYNGFLDTQPWLSVFLGYLIKPAPPSSQVMSVVIVNRADGYGDRLANATVRVGNVSLTIDTPREVLYQNALFWKQTQPLATGASIEVLPTSGPIAGRWVHIQNLNPSATSYMLNLHEVEVYGIRLVTPCPAFPGYTVTLDMDHPYPEDVLLDYLSGTSDPQGGCDSYGNCQGFVLGRLPAYYTWGLQDYTLGFPFRTNSNPNVASPGSCLYLKIQA